MAIKEVKKGDFIGYGTAFLAQRNMKVAVIPIGYAHGYNLSLSNIGSVLINGKKANVIGIVNMNCITVDVTDTGTVNKGDEVVLIGNQKRNSITVSSFSDQTQQLNYEFLTRLPVYIPRKIIN
jgi:alanine racemase